MIIGWFLNIGGFGFVEVGVKLCGNGGVLVDEWMCILKFGVYVVGDVIGCD